MSIKSESMSSTTERKHYDGPAESADMEVGDSDSIQSDWNQAVDSFDKMELKQELLRGINACGFEKLSAIQQLAIISCVKERDVIAQIQSEIERTATLSISILQRIDPALKECQALILTHTRQLANLTQKILMGLSKFMENCKCHVSIRGKGMQYEKDRLAEGPQVVVGTPVRVYNMIRNKSLKIDHIKIFVLDEADRILSLNFKEQVQQVFTMVPKKPQLLLFCAKFSPKVLRFSKKFMRKPLRILEKKEEFTLELLEDIKQFYLFVEKKEWKIKALKDLDSTLSITQAVIFCNTWRTVVQLTDILKMEGRTVCDMHCKNDQHTNEQALHHFTNGRGRYMITTDNYAKRIIGVQKISLIINYDLPLGHKTNKNYARRVGLGVRFDHKAVVINFVTPDDKSSLSDIEQFYNIQIAEM